MKKGLIAIALFNIAYVVYFAFSYVASKNYEFMAYIGIVVLLGLLVLATLKYSKFDYLILWLLSIWGFFHIAGGTVQVGDAVLYKYIFINLFQIEDIIVLRFDHVIHFYGFGVTALVIFHILRQKLKPTIGVYLISIFAAMGLGSLNEVIEFIIATNFESGVGGYINNSLDLVFNTLGAITAMIYAKLAGR